MRREIKVEGEQPDRSLAVSRRRRGENARSTVNIMEVTVVR